MPLVVATDVVGPRLNGYVSVVVLVAGTVADFEPAAACLSALSTALIVRGGKEERRSLNVDIAWGR